MAKSKTAATQDIIVDERVFTRISKTSDGVLRQVIFTKGKSTPTYVPVSDVLTLNGVPAAAITALKANDGEAAAKALTGFSIANGVSAVVRK